MGRFAGRDHSRHDQINYVEQSLIPEHSYCEEKRQHGVMTRQVRSSDAIRRLNVQEQDNVLDVPMKAPAPI